MTGEGWSTMMYILWKHHNRVIVFSFFTFLILFGVFFVLNLFLAVISDSFSKVNQSEDNARDAKKEE
jgi:preprotein translocase subunit SecG